MANSIFKKTSNGWSNQKIECKTSGGTNVAPTYKRTHSGWERIDQQLVTHTKIIEGYAQWNASYRNSSGSGNANYKDNNIYQGKYDSYNYLGLICCTNLFNTARNSGTIKKVELRLKNNHAYYNSGLKTKICGAWSLPNTRPSTASFGWSNSTAYSGEWHFAKNGSSPQWLTLNSNVNNVIQNNQINGFRLLSPTGFDLNNYGYFEGSGDNRPYVKITVEYQVWE